MYPFLEFIPKAIKISHIIFHCALRTYLFRRMFIVIMLCIQGSNSVGNLEKLIIHFVTGEKSVISPRMAWKWGKKSWKNAQKQSILTSCWSQVACDKAKKAYRNFIQPILENCRKMGEKWGILRVKNCGNPVYSCYVLSLSVSDHSPTGLSVYLIYWECVCWSL